MQVGQNKRAGGGRVKVSPKTILKVRKYHEPDLQEV